MTASSAVPQRLPQPVYGEAKPERDRILTPIPSGDDAEPAGVSYSPARPTDRSLITTSRSAAKTNPGAFVPRGLFSDLGTGFASFGPHRVTTGQRSG